MIIHDLTTEALYLEVRGSVNTRVDMLVAALPELEGTMSRLADFARFGKGDGICWDEARVLYMSACGANGGRPRHRLNSQSMPADAIALAMMLSAARRVEGTPCARDVALLSGVCRATMYR